MSRDCTKEAFEKDVRDHAMKVVIDQDTHRHLIFKKPGDSAYWFEIVTWPGTLCIHGDMGTYVFERLKDMFEFFRSGRGEINRRYWSEKLRGDRIGHGRIGMEFSEQKFKAAVVSDFRQWWAGSLDTAEDYQARRECWDELKESVLRACDDGEVRAFDAANDFRFEVHRLRRVFRFHDFWDHNFSDYTWHFTWYCHALVWAIAKYDALKDAAKAAQPTESTEVTA